MWCFACRKLKWLLGILFFHKFCTRSLQGCQHTYTVHTRVTGPRAYPTSLRRGIPACHRAHTIGNLVMPHDITECFSTAEESRPTQGQYETHGGRFWTTNSGSVRQWCYQPTHKSYVAKWKWFVLLFTFSPRLCSLKTTQSLKNYGSIEHGNCCFIHGDMVQNGRLYIHLF